MTLSGKKSEIVKEICERVEFINELKKSNTQRMSTNCIVKKSEGGLV